MKLFKKILIANRGEIAVRIIRSAQKLGIRTVALYAEADADALHVKMADEAYYLGENDLAETYLNIDKIIKFAKISQSEAIHPGYGFLAENPAFVAACEKANVTFIGPDSRSIKLMGNKIESRKFIKKIGIPMTEGKTGDVETLIGEGKKIPLPILVKAAAGGGGKGMRIVNDYDELPSIIETTMREAKNYFGDGTVYVEKYIEQPRHIEVQVMADHHGNVIHLFERECSIQRRYQKIIEESPSPTLTPRVREKICNAAVKIASEIGYVNAGTVEFLVDKDLNFYFLEMNTRVQVEHPVTEMVTGTDIVREQIFVAAGNPLSLKQDDLKQNGHAIESRIYAEDPENNFLPSPGVMSFYHQPKGEGIRVDTGIDRATEIHSFFDPMISKLIVWAEDREIAREKMITALKEFIVHGIKTNISYLIKLLQQEAYIENVINTKFCDEHTDYITGLITKEKEETPVHVPLIAILTYGFFGNKSKDQVGTVWQQIGYWRDHMEITLVLDGKEYLADIVKKEKDFMKVEIAGDLYKVRLVGVENGRITMVINDHYHSFYASKDVSGGLYLSHEGNVFKLRREDVLINENFFGSLDSGMGDSNAIFSPMPGKVIKVNFKPGDQVKKGETLLIVEAMKMENNIVATHDAVVESIEVKTGDMVNSDKKLILFKNE